MAGRRIQPEVQKLFEKYVGNSLHVRRLQRPEALDMLQQEFSLSPADSQEIMEYFDADKNGSLSLWEFQHFYTLAGPGVINTATQFSNFDIDKKRHLSREQIQVALRAMKSADDQDLEDKDVEMILKTAKDAEKITLGDYIALMYRLKLYKKARR